MRAATSPELAKLRSDGQWSQLYLAFASQAPVFQASVNGTFSTTDQVASVPFDTVTLGAYTDLVENMTLYVGSSAGASDLGMARIKSATSSAIKIGRTSDIAWADNLYLTAVRDFGLWAKQPYLDPAGQRLDDDLTYTDQLIKMRPVPILGPDALLRLSSGTVTYHPDASGSWVPASTITAYSWSVTPASGVTITGGTTATPGITITIPGTYDLQLTVTAANGRSTTGHRTLRVVGGAETPITEFTLDSLQADIASGGWSATITMLAQADQTYVMDRGKVFIYADDYYAGTLGSIGQLPELEHQVFVGWILGETIEYDASYGTVTFEAKGAGHWLTTLGSTATYIEPVDVAPANWNQMTRTTLAEIVWYFAVWRSTTAQTIDVIRPSLTTEFGGITAGMGTIWSQMTDAASNRLLCEPRCDRYGRLFFDRDPQIMTSAEKNALPVIMAMTQDDCQERIEIERKITPETGVLELSGLYFGGGTTNLILSRASGWTLKRHGKPETRDRIVAVDQADANRIAGCLLGKADNPYPRVTLRLAQNNRMIDIAGAAYCTLTIAANDTPRGISWTNQRLIPRKITQTWSPDSGAPTTTVEFEPECAQATAVTVDVPTIGKINVPIAPLPPIVPWNPFTNPEWPGGIPPIIQDPPKTQEELCLLTAAANGPYPLYISDTLYDNDHRSAYIAFSGDRMVVRGAGATFPTTLVINCLFEERQEDGSWLENPSASWAEAYILDVRGTRVATGTWSGTGKMRSITFIPPANTRIAAFEIQLTSYQTLVFNTYTDEVILDFAGPVPYTLDYNNLSVTNLRDTGIQVHRDISVSFKGDHVYADEGGMDITFFNSGSSTFDPDPPVWLQHLADITSFTMTSYGPGSDVIGWTFDFGSAMPNNTYLFGVRVRRRAGFGAEGLYIEGSNDGSSWSGGATYNCPIDTWVTQFYNAHTFRYVRVRVSEINEVLDVAYFYFFDNTGDFPPAMIVTKVELNLSSDTTLDVEASVWSNNYGDTPRSWGLGVYSNGGADFTDSTGVDRTGKTNGDILGFTSWGASMEEGSYFSPIGNFYPDHLTFLTGDGVIFCRAALETLTPGTPVTLAMVEKYVIRKPPTKRLTISSAVVYNICA